MVNTRCYLCNSDNIGLRSPRVRDRSDIQVLQCNDCGLVFLSRFDHISESFYNDSKMHGNSGVDFDKWMMETKPDDERRFNYVKSIIKDKDVLDIGCGNGQFLKMASGICSSVQGVELEEQSIQKISEWGISVSKNIEDIKNKFDVITMFHVLEHIPDPITFIEKIKPYLTPNGILLIEVPNENDALISLYDNKAFKEFTYWSCHLFLFNENTLKTVAEYAGYTVNYVRHVQRYSMANHMYWLANNKPGGHVKWNCVDSDSLHAAYETNLANIKATDTIIACLEVK